MAIMSRKKIDYSKVILFSLFFSYFISRLINLDNLPIFNDEAMYLNWGRLIVENPKENLFISLTDGQQPFFLWLTAISYWLGKSSFLFYGRLISVLAGLGTMGLMYLIGKELFNRNVGIISAFLYLMVPFTLWYDRLAVKDGFLMFLSALIFYFTLKQTKQKNWLPVLGAGLALGTALLTKSIAYFFVGLYPIIVLSTAGSGVYNSRSLHRSLYRIFLALFLAFFIQSLIYFSPLSDQIGPKNSVFLLSPSEILQLPFQLWRNNLYSTVTWWWQYYQIPILILGVIGFFRLLKEKERCKLLTLSAWIGLPIVFEILTAKIYIPRYFLFTFVAFGIIVAYGFERILSLIKSRNFQIILFVLVFLPSLWLDKKILFKPAVAPLPQIERWQYFEGWPAGYGLTDLISFIQEEYLQERKELLIITEKETLVSSGLSLYLMDYSNLRIRRVFDLGTELEEQSFPLPEKGKEILAVIHHHQKIPDSWSVEEVARIARFHSDQYFFVLKPELLYYEGSKYK